MGTHCSPLVAGLFLCCYERDSITEVFAKEKRNDMIYAFNSTFRYLDDSLTLNRWFTEYKPDELQLNTANSSDTEVAFLDLNLFSCIYNGYKTI